jgi:antitoxin VapB
MERHDPDFIPSFSSIDRRTTDVYHGVYTSAPHKDSIMASRKKTKLFMSGNSQAVRIPREFQLEGNEVEIQRRGNTLIIRPKKETWQPLTDSLSMFTDDFMKEGRAQPPQQKRKRTFA